MGRGLIGLTGVALLLLGFFLGRSQGPTPIEFPAADQARSSVEMERAVEEALLAPQAFPRARRLIRLFEGLSPENVEGAARAVTSRAARWDPVDLQLFLTAWVHLDPLAAVLEVQSWPVQSRREIGMNTLIREWAASGRKLEAVNFVQTLQDPQLYNLAVGPLVRGWALSGDVDGALDVARRLWDAEERRDVVDGFVRGVLHVSGPAETLEIAKQVAPRTGGDFEKRIARVTLNLVAREDPAAAARTYSEFVAEGPAEWLDGMLEVIAALWRNRDPQAALEWLMSLSEISGPEHSKALTKTIGTWANRDFAAAWSWLERERGALEGSGELAPTDSALVAGLVRRMARTRPVEAARWALRLRPESDREKMLTRVAHFWSRQDHAAASRWIDGLELSPDVRSRILQAAERGRQTVDAAKSQRTPEAGDPLD
jgi:hypothetical protein